MILLYVNSCLTNYFRKSICSGNRPNTESTICFIPHILTWFSEESCCVCRVLWEYYLCGSGSSLVSSLHLLVEISDSILWFNARIHDMYETKIWRRGHIVGFTLNTLIQNNNNDLHHMATWNKSLLEHTVNDKIQKDCRQSSCTLHYIWSTDYCTFWLNVMFMFRGVSGWLQPILHISFTLWRELLCHSNM